MAGVAGCGGGDDQEATNSTTPASIEIAEFLFQPEAITVTAGTTVTWTNQDEARHTATADDGSFDTGDLDQSDKAELTLDEPGSFSYYCRFHPFMTATIEVE